MRELLDEGLLDRDRVVEDVLGAPTREETAGTQKGLSALLAAARFGPGDARDRVPLLHGVMATARSSVTSVVLPALLPSLSSADELAELSATVFSRKEKKAKTDVLKALTAKDAPDRFPRDGLVAALSTAAAVVHTSLADRARTALVRLGVDILQAEAPDDVGDLWSPPPMGLVARPLVPIEPGAAAVTAAITATAASSTACDGARLVDVFVRWGWQDAGAVRHLLAHPPAGGWGVSDAVAVGSLWAEGRATRETFGAVAFTALVERLRALTHAGSGELDLMQALLRLEPVDPDRLRELDGLRVPVRPAVRTSKGRRGRPRSQPGSATCWRWPGATRRPLPPARNPRQPWWPLPARAELSGAAAARFLAGLPRAAPGPSYYLVPVAGGAAPVVA